MSNDVIRNWGIKQDIVVYYRLKEHQ